VFHDESGQSAFNGFDSQLDLSSLNRVMNPDNVIHQMSQPQISLPSEQFPFTEGPGIKSFTFDEIYSSGLSIKDADGAGTDEGSLWQVTWPCVSVW
jgi:calmodulin-binding transcription activator